MIYHNILGCSKEIADWLLSELSPPPVRYQAASILTQQDYKEKMHVTKEDVLNWLPLKKILALQQEDGGFPVTQKGKPGIPTFYALILMSKCGMDLSDKPVRKAIEYIESKHTLNGVLSWNNGGSGILPCYAGVTASHISKMSHGENKIVHDVADWIVNYQRFDHKEDKAGGCKEWPYLGPANFGCWQSVSCYHGVVASLALLASIPQRMRSLEIRTRIREALHYLELHKVFRKTTTGEPMFRHLTNFFIFGQWRMNLLDILEVIIDSDPETAHTSWIMEAFDEIERHTVEGRILHRTEYRTYLEDPSDFEPTGVPSYFLTLQWAKITQKMKQLQQAG